MGDYASHEGIVYLQIKGLLTRWKKHYCALFMKNQRGIARLEIYSSEKDCLYGKNARSVLLKHCIAVRIVPVSGAGNILEAVQLSTEEGNLLIGFETDDDARLWQDYISRAAFGETAVVLDDESLRRQSSADPPPTPLSAPINSPDDDSAYDAPWDLRQFTVVLVATDSSRRIGLSEGTYELCFGSNAMMLKRDDALFEAWQYAIVSWFGYGTQCCAFEVEETQTFEFKCPEPAKVFEKLRTHLRLKPSAETIPSLLKQAYFGNFAPAPRRTGSVSSLTSVGSRVRPRRSASIISLSRSISSRRSTREKSRHESNENDTSSKNLLSSFRNFSIRSKREKAESTIAGDAESDVGSEKSAIRRLSRFFSRKKKADQISVSGTSIGLQSLSSVNPSYQRFEPSEADLFYYNRQPGQRASLAAMPSMHEQFYQQPPWMAPGGYWMPPPMSPGQQQAWFEQQQFYYGMPPPPPPAHHYPAPFPPPQFYMDATATMQPPPRPQRPPSLQFQPTPAYWPPAPPTADASFSEASYYQPNVAVQTQQAAAVPPVRRESSTSFERPSPESVFGDRPSPQTKPEYTAAMESHVARNGGKATPRVIAIPPPSHQLRRTVSDAANARPQPAPRASKPSPVFTRYLEQTIQADNNGKNAPESSNTTSAVSPQKPLVKLPSGGYFRMPSPAVRRRQSVQDPQVVNVTANSNNYEQTMQNTQRIDMITEVW